jgi:hypothetical protein
MVALHIWATTHGIVSLFIGLGNTNGRAMPMSAEELLESAMLVYWQGLGLPSG